MSEMESWGMIMSKIRVLTAALLLASLFALPGCNVTEKSTKTTSYTQAGQNEKALVSLQELPDTTLSEQTDVIVRAADPVQADLSVTKEASSESLTETAADTDIPAQSDSSAITAADISALPAGSIVDEFLSSDQIVNGCFYFTDISDEIFARMDGKSYKEGCTVAIADLSYVRVLYYGFDSSVHIGELVVNRKIAQDIVEIFRGLYDAKYPIGKMVLVDDYDADDNASMIDNNTSAFNFRVVNGTTTLSRHALGLAIDINPLYNPWIYTLKGNTVIDPAEGAQYADRTLDCVYYLDHDDLCYKLFIGHGFTWGGDWDASKDYQHFSKET